MWKEYLVHGCTIENGTITSFSSFLIRLNIWLPYNHIFVSVYMCIYQREIKIYIHTNVHVSFIYNSRKMVPAQISNNRWMDQLIVHICTMEYNLAIKRNKIPTRTKTLINLRNIMLSHMNWIQKYILHASIYVKLGNGKLIYSDRKQIMRGLSEVMEIFSTLITMVVAVMDTFVKHAKLTFSMGAFLLYMNYSSGKSIFFKCASINYVLKMLKGFRIYEASGCRGRQEGASGWRAWNWHAPISREGFLKQIFLLRGEKADQGKETTGAKQKSGVFTYWEKRKLITVFWSYFF